MAKQKLTLKKKISVNYETTTVAPDFSAEDYIEIHNNNNSKTDKQIKTAISAIP